jgi:site-specific recombinase
MRTLPLADILRSITPESSLQDLTYAANLVQWLRPLGEEQYAGSDEKVTTLCDVLEQDNTLQHTWAMYMSGLLSSRSYTRLFTELGLPSEHRFFDELRKRVGSMILPPLSDKKEALSLLAELFGNVNDHVWITQVANASWERLFLLLFSGQRIRQILKNEVIVAMQILANRIASLGLEPAMLERLSVSGNSDSAFLFLSKEVLDFTRRNESGESTPEDYKHLKVLAGQCRTIIASLRKKGRSQGVSIRMVYLLIRIERNIDRLILLTSLLEPADTRPACDSCVMFQLAVNDLHRRHSISELFNDTTRMLAYQVVEHNSQAGEHYITTNAKEYWLFFYQSAMGGVVIGVTTLLKMMIHHLQKAPFVEAALYGLNYAASFVVIFLGHFALATKQPSMTASALATALDDEKGRSKVDIEETGFLIIDMFRSQFISFFGNLLTVFPMAIFMAFLYLKISGYALINESKALRLLSEINPFDAPVIWYGAIAGVCLFLSGLFTGYVNNSLIFNKIPERIRAHKKLIRWLGYGIVSKVAGWTERNWAGVSGNILLGFMLGFAGFFGFIFGLPIDIRHITLATGSLGIAVYTLSFQLTLEQWLFPILGIFLIGFMNFSVSFGLSLFLALRSRKINFKETRNLIFFVIGQCIYHPSLLFLPPRNRLIE